MKNKIIFILGFILILLSCKNDNKNNITLDKIDLANTVYYFTNNFDSINCKVYSACDCCSDNLVFLDKSEFILISYCQGDEEYFKGKYVILDSTIQLNFNSSHVLKEYSWEYELDTTGTVKSQYNIKKIKSDSHPKRMDIFYCKNQVCLNASVGEEGYYGVLDTLQVNSIMVKMKKDGIWKNL